MPNSTLLKNKEKHKACEEWFLCPTLQIPFDVVWSFIYIVNHSPNTFKCNLLWNFHTYIFTGVNGQCEGKDHDPIRCIYQPSTIFTLISWSLPCIMHMFGYNLIDIYNFQHTSSAWTCSFLHQMVLELYSYCKSTYMLSMANAATILADVIGIV